MQSKRIILAPLLVGVFFLVVGLIIFQVFDSSGPGTGRLKDTPERKSTPGSGRKGAWVDEVVFVRETDRGKVVNLLERGRLDVYAEGISNPLLYQRIQDSPEVDYSMSYGSSAELTFNTAGPYFTDSSSEKGADSQQSGRLNPFHNRRIREAFNWLLDRDYIAEELYGGLAVPRYLPISTALPDYAKLAEQARALELRYRHNPEKAKRIINNELRKLGAEKKGETWHYDGEPIEIKILIRTEDARKQVGDYVGNILENMGFEVQRMYRTAAEASGIWIASDPNAGQWHLYTGGWVSTIINRDLAGQLDQFYTPRGRPMPLWQSYNPVPELDELAEKLARRDYDTWAERQEMMSRGLELALQESTRIWLVDQNNIWPKRSNVAMAVDLAGGIGGSGLWPYTLRFKDRIGGRIVIGGSKFLTGPWNPVDGSNWVFDQMIMRGLQDPVILPDPYTGLFWPQRLAEVEVTVKEGTPVSRTHDWLELKQAPRIEVPPQAWIDWDSERGRFISVIEKYPDGIEARTRTRVVYQDDYLKRKWHDGSQASLADIVLPWILTFERADEDSPLFDQTALPSFKSFQKHFRGWHIISEAPLTIEIFSDQIFPDAEWIVGHRTPGSSAWHVLSLGMMAEKNQELAFSSHKADRLNIEWLNLIGGPSLTVLKRQLKRAMEEEYIPYPKVLSRWISEDEARQRYESLKQWHQEKGHFWVSDGPFYLQSARPVEGMVILRRYENFPDPADKWLRFTEPEIPLIEIDGPRSVKAGEPLRFLINISHDLEPYPEKDLSRIGYILFDHADNLIAEGEAEKVRDGVWKVALSRETTLELEKGAASFQVAVNSKRVALPSFASQPFAVIPRIESD